MLAETLISTTLPEARPNDAGTQVLALMREHFTEQLPVVEERELLGLVSAEALQRAVNLNDAAVVTDAFMYPAAGSFVYNTQHALDAVSLAAQTGNAVVPVLNLDQQYQGSIGRKELLKFIGELAAASEPGAILVLEVPRHAYQLRQIADIIESNGAAILSLNISNVPETTALYVTLKLSVTEVTQILMSFERYGYTVAYTFTDTRQMDGNDDRFEGLMRFLNV